jgi:hypothetical protein
LEDWKIKISVLWLFAALAYLSYGLLFLIEPGNIANITAGKLESLQIGPALLLFLAIFMLVPLVMAFLTLTLKSSANRWANVVLGAIFAVLWLADLVEAVQSLSAYATLVRLAGVVALVLIVWYAWKSKPT